MRANPPHAIRQFALFTVLSLTAIPLTPGATESQEPDLVNIETCGSRCSKIVFTKVGQVGGDPEDPALMSWRGVPEGLGGGGWFTSGTYESGVVAFYDSMGKFVRISGREGGGPGEYRDTRDFQGPVGTGWIVDGGNQRVTPVGPDGNLGQAFPFYGYVSYTAPIDSDRVAILGTLFTESEGVPPERIHIVRDNGEVESSFGDSRDNPIVLDARRLYYTPRGTLIAASQESLAVQEWSLDGRLLRVLSRDAEWFSDTRGRLGIAAYEAALLSAAVDSLDRMWLVVKKPAEEAGPPPRNVPSSLADFVETFSSGGVIEVVDLDQVRVVATTEVEMPYMFPVIPFQGFFVSPAEDNQGYVHFDLWKARIEP